MNKSYKQQSIVSGLSVNDILNMDIDTFNKLNEKDLRKVVGRLVSAGNKRLRNFEKTGESSPATRHIKKSGGYFSTKGKDLNSLRSEYARAKNFMLSKTSTKTGYKKVKKETAKNLSQKGLKISPEQLDDILKAYENLKELDPSVSEKALKYTVLQQISEEMENTTKSPEEIATTLINRVSELYEKTQGGVYGGVSGFFEI